MAVWICRASRGSLEMWTIPAPSRGWTVLERGRKLKDDWTSLSQTFLPVSSGVSSRRGARLGPVPNPSGGAGRPGPSGRATRRVCTGRGCQARRAGSHRRGAEAQTDRWTRLLALHPGRRAAAGDPSGQGAAQGARPGAPRLPRPPPPPTRAPVIGSARPWLRAEARLPPS